MRFPGRDRILVAKMRYTGDVLLITPFIRALRRGFPKAWIGVLVNEGTEEVLKENPDIDEVITFDRDMGKLAQLSFVKALRRKKIQTIIDLTGSDRSAWIAKMSGADTKVGIKGTKAFRNKYLYNMLVDTPVSVHQIDKNLDIAKKFGLRRFYKLPVLVLTDAEIKKGEELVAPQGGPYVVIHPGARRWYKSWPAENFAALANKIKSLGLKVVIAGGPDDVKKCAEIEGLVEGGALNLSGSTTIRELAAVIKGALFFVGNDSAPMHISYTVGTTTIALFGPTDWRVWHPIGEEHYVFAKDVDCTPCGHSNECEKTADWCMRLITVEEVTEAVEQIVKEAGLQKS